MRFVERLLVGVGAGLLTVVSSVTAQTRFAEPATEVDVSQYATPDQCLAGVARMIASKEDRLPMHRDTVGPGAISWRTSAWPSDIVAMAQRCSARWPAVSAPVEEFRWLFDLYLVAGREADALEIMARSLASAKTDRERGMMIGIAATVYMEARPIRVAEADSLLAHIAAFRAGVVPGDWQCMTNWRLRSFALEVGDTVRALRAAARADVAWLALTPAERARGLDVSRAVLNTAFLHHAKLMDSLRHSIDAYVRLARRRTEETLKGLPPRFLNPLGTKLPPLDGPFWFPAKPESAPPTRGKISIVVTLIDECAQGLAQNDICHRNYAMLRRIARKYPDVEVTLLTFVEGYFANRAPPTAAEEAELKRRWLLDDCGLPGRLVVVPGSFTQIPNPDLRIVQTFWTQALLNVYTSNRNEQRYSYKNRWLAPLLVMDQSGVVVMEAEAGIEQEKMLMDLIEVLQQRY